jgi:fatty acid desaturase
MTQVARSSRTINWYRTPIGREQQRELNQASDVKAGLQIGGHLSLLALTASVAWSVQDRPWLLVPALFLHGTVYVFLLNATHELSHGSVFRTRFLNRFFLRLFCFFGWRNHVLFWASHAEHHKYTLHPPDDLEVVLPRRLTLREFLRVTVFDPRIFYATLRKTVVHATGRVEGEWEQHLFPEDEPHRRRALINSARGLLLGHTVLVVVSLWLGLWLVPILTTLGVFYGGWLRFLCNNTQHTGLQDDVADFRLCTRTVLLGPLTRFLYWHMNFHIEHHMYAAVPCYNLGRLHRAIRHDLPESPRGLWATWRQILAVMKRQEIEPEYEFAPVLPA